MSGVRRKAPRPADVSESLEEHPATRAWLRVNPRSAVPARIEQFSRPGKIKKRRKSSVFRLHGVGPGTETIVAKCGRPDTVALERLIYEGIIARLPVSSLRVLGSVPEPDDNMQWLFVEDAGERHFFRNDPEHRALAARWLAAMHAGAASLVGEELPSCGPDFFLRFLKESLAIVVQTQANLAPTPARQRTLDQIRRVTELLEMRWPDLALICARTPTTLVHGDFIDKNVRVGDDSGAERPLYVFDWEVAGRGSPAVDLATSNWGAHDDGIREYFDVAREHWSGLTENDVRRMLEVGRVFRYVASIRWLCEKLPFGDAEKPLEKISGYLQSLDAIASKPIRPSELEQ
jgi:thiamine kinase-like enzyme